MKVEIKNKNVLFLFILLLVSLLYNYHEIILKGPWFPHMWRATDCLSIAVNYYKEGLNFFKPEVHWTGPNGNGKTISEFPIIYYTVAKLWTLFGKQYFIYRGLNILFVFSGLFSLYKISYRILKDNFWAIFIPIFLFSSPALVFYTNNFLPNAPAFGLSLTGIWCYFLFIDTGKKKWIWIAVACFTIAGLLKITSLIIVVAFLSFQLLQTITDFRKYGFQITKQLGKFIPHILIGTIIFVWVKYTDHYNSTNNRIFLQDLFPIWDLNQEERKEIWKSLYFTLLPSFFNKKALAVIGILLLTNVVFWVKKGSNYLLIIFISFIGAALYVLLWFKAFDVHDYYLINLLILIPLILLGFLSELKNRVTVVFKSKLLKLIAFAGVVTLIYLTTMMNRLKYDVNDPMLKYEIALSKAEKELYAYKQYKYRNTTEALESITPYLRSLGINREDLVISIPDNSINISLVLMDQKGFTDYGYVPTKGKPKERIEEFKSIGAKYLIVNDIDKIEHQEFKPYLQNKIGEYKNVSIFKL